MKKFICAILAICLLIPAIPVFAEGDTTANASNAYFRVDNAYYSTLEGALADAETSADRTVYLLKDVSVAEKGLSVPAGADIAIDLGGHTLTATDKNEYLISSIKSDLTVKNGTVNVSLGLVVQDGGHLILDDMKLNVTDTSSSARPAVKLSYEGNTTLTVRDSHLKTVGPGESLVLVEFATDGTVNLEGNTILEYAGVLDNEEQNCGAVAVQQAWGTGYVSADALSNTDLVLNVGANAKIVNTAPSSEDQGQIASGIILSTCGEVTINLEKGATIEIDRVSGASKSYHIHMVNHFGNLTVNDNGANWSVSAKTLSEGSIYFNDLWSDGYNVIGWTDGERLIKTQTAYSVTDATEAVSYSPVCFKDGDFELLDGASIRKEQSERAIRFSTVVSDELIDLLGDNVQFGTIIAEGSTNPTRSSGKKYKFKDKRFVPYESGKSVYHAALILNDSSDDKTAYKKSYCAISYMTVEYYDGTEDTFYTDFDYNNVRSMKTVASKLNANGYAHSVIDYILSLFPSAGEDVGDGTSVLVGFCTNASLYDGAFNSQVGWKAAGMGYIIKTSDGKLIVIDGGNTEDAEAFCKLLLEYGSGDTVTIDHWIITHPHGDHVNALIAIAANAELSAKIDIDNLVFYFPTDYDTATKNYNTKLQSIATQYGANVITPTKGQVISVGTAIITFLYVPTNYSSFTSGNQLSLIFTVETVNKTVMFTGDAFTDGLTAVYNEYGSALKCDILQMPHHFLCDTGYKPFYEAADAQAVLLPTCIAGYEAMYTIYKDNTKHKANDWAAQNADEVYKAFEGTFEIEL